MTHPFLAAVSLFAGLTAPLAACGSDESATERVVPADTRPAVPAEARAERPVCEPGHGLPRPRSGCPDPHPQTGWLHSSGNARPSFQPFETLGNNAAGAAYAHERGLEFPFPDDYFDAATGTPHAFELDRRTMCTGIILVGYREPLDDHVVECR